jgi:hypothetical protein
MDVSLCAVRTPSGRFWKKAPGPPALCHGQTVRVQGCCGMTEGGMQVRADVRRDMALVACKRCIEATFTESDWIEVGYLTGASDVVTNHPRLLRSLGWGDDDYGACVLTVLEKIVGGERRAPRNRRGFIRLEQWLCENDSALYAALYGGNLDLAPEDPTNLSDPAAMQTRRSGAVPRTSAAVIAGSSITRTISSRAGRVSALGRAPSRVPLCSDRWPSITRGMQASSTTHNLCEIGVYRT